MEISGTNYLANPRLLKLRQTQTRTTRKARECNPDLQRLQPHQMRPYSSLRRTCQKPSRAVQWRADAQATEMQVQQFLPMIPLLFLVFACQTPEAPKVQPDVQITADPHVEALGRDPEPLPESLRQALKDFRDRFACNAISGCPSEQVLLQAGWVIRPYVQQIFEKAPEQSSYRARAIHLLALLRDPQARPFLRDRLDDRDPETRALAIFGLGLLNDEQVQRLANTVTRDDPSVWMAPVRLSALWVAQRAGDRTANRAFLHQLALLARQQLAMSGLLWGLELCQRGDGLDCHAVFPLMARHPNFQVRRALVKALAAAPRPEYAAALVEMTGETATSIAEPAEIGLKVLSGLDLHGHAAWQQWCQQTACEKKAQEAIRELDRQLALPEK